MLLGDSVLGQMKEALTPHSYVRPADLPEKDWVVSGKAGRPQRVVKSLYLGDGELEAHNWKLYGKYQQLKEKEVRYERNNFV